MRWAGRGRQEMRRWKGEGGREREERGRHKGRGLREKGGRERVKEQREKGSKNVGVRVGGVGRGGEEVEGGGCKGVE